jgi:hypothetical protein
MAPRGFLCSLRHVSDSLFLLALRSRDLRCSGHEMLTRAASVQNIHLGYCKRVEASTIISADDRNHSACFFLSASPRPEAYCRNSLRL